MTDKEIAEEIKKCRESPYYFATTYLTKTYPIQGGMKTEAFSTNLTEEEFNRYFGKGNFIKARKIEEDEDTSR